MNNESYTNPLNTRYASKKMLSIFSAKHKYQTWRKIWVALAKAEQKAGLDITNTAIKELEDNINNIDFERVAAIEKENRHEVMAHLKAFAELAPNGGKILHLGETSAFVMDNGDIVVYKDALLLLREKMVATLTKMSLFALKYKDLPTLSFTHFQQAQPSTLGKRCTLWLESLRADFERLLFELDNLALRGVKGTTGTAASFKHLLNDDYEKLLKLENDVASELYFSKTSLVTSQVYDRKTDVYLGDLLKNIAISSHKITNDLRLLQHLKEVEEFFAKDQIGSSAMPYKTNPILCERVSSLAKFTLSLNGSLEMVASTQWLERTLDDSANKRLALPQMFLAVDAIVGLLYEIFEKIHVNEAIINRHLQEHLPFLITENILMDYVKKGGDRAKGHEIIKHLAMEAGREIRSGKDNNLLLLLEKNSELNLSKAEIAGYMDASKLTGFSKEQVEFFIKHLEKLLAPYQSLKAEMESSVV